MHCIIIIIIIIIIIVFTRLCVGRNSVVDVAPDYEPDGPGSNPGGVKFSSPVQIGRGAHPASCTMGTGPSPGVKRPRRGVDHPPPSTAEVKEREQPYLYSSVWAFMTRSRLNVAFLFARLSLDGTAMSKRVAWSQSTDRLLYISEFEGEGYIYIYIYIYI